jgi:hypothetical protein
LAHSRGHQHPPRPRWHRSCCHNPHTQGSIQTSHHKYLPLTWCKWKFIVSLFPGGRLCTRKGKFCVNVSVLLVFNFCVVLTVPAVTSWFLKAMEILNLLFSSPLNQACIYRKVLECIPWLRWPSPFVLGRNCTRHLADPRSQKRPQSKNTLTPVSVLAGRTACAFLIFI